MKKILIFIVAYNAERHIAAVFSRIPYSRLAEGTELLLIDYASKDATFSVAQGAARSCPIKSTLLKNPVNLGNDWNPNSLYYAERKGIAFPTADWIPLPGPQLDESLANLGPDERLGAVVVNEQLLNAGNQAFFADYLQKLGMSSQAQRTAFGLLFPARNLGGDGRP